MTDKKPKSKGGRPVGSRSAYSIKELMAAIKAVEGEKKKPLLKHFVQRAYESDSVLSHLAKKVLPDLKAIEHSGDLALQQMTRHEILNEITSLLGNKDKAK